MRSLILGLVFACAASMAHADEVNACLKEGYGSYKAYKVHGQFVSGNTLLEATHDYSKWSSWKSYFAVFWSKDQVTVIELPSGYSSYLPAYSMRVTDQEGRDWDISSSTIYCF